MVYLNEKQFKVVMVKLFQAVGKKYQSISKSCKGDDWFMKYSWSRKEEKEFKVWLTNYLVKTLNIPILLANKKAEMFIFQYGWKYKEED